MAKQVDYAALAALSLLGARPVDPGKAKAFIVSCQTGGGGFARSPSAAPFLDASWHGVAGLSLLKEMDARPFGVMPEISSPLSRLLVTNHRGSPKRVYNHESR